MIARGQWWRLLTPALLHGSTLHLLMNNYSLNNVGPLTERMSGRARFAAVYAVSAVTGVVGSVIMTPRMAVGASGARSAALRWQTCAGAGRCRAGHLRRPTWSSACEALLLCCQLSAVKAVWLACASTPAFRPLLTQALSLAWPGRWQCSSIGIGTFLVRRVMQF